MLCCGIDLSIAFCCITAFQVKINLTFMQHACNVLTWRILCKREQCGSATQLWCSKNRPLDRCTIQWKKLLLETDCHMPRIVNCNSPNFRSCSRVLRTHKCSQSTDIKDCSIHDLRLDQNYPITYTSFILACRFRVTVLSGHTALALICRYGQSSRVTDIGKKLSTASGACTVVKKISSSKWQAILKVELDSQLPSVVQ